MIAIILLLIMSYFKEESKPIFGRIYTKFFDAV